MTDIICKPAIKIAQGKRVLYATSFTVADFLLRKEFYRVDHLAPDEDGDNEGFQRILDESRAKALAKDLSSAYKQDEAILPTSVLLATAGKIDYDEAARQISFSAAPNAGVCPFSVVDGQHRIAGLCEFAAQNPEDPKIKNFPVFVSIISGIDNAEQSLQFLIVNAKQRAVDKGLQRRLIRKFTNKYKVDALPYLPAWVKRAVEGGADKKAGDIVLFLSQEKESPWRGRIILTNTPKRRGEKRTGISETSFARSVQVYLLAANNPLARMDSEWRNKIIMNYWNAVVSLFVEGDEDTVVFKTNGVNFFHMVSGAVLYRAADVGNYKPETIKDIFQKARKTAPEADFMHPGWWRAGTGPGRGASKMNQAGVSECATAFYKMLNDAYAIQVGADQV